MSQPTINDLLHKHAPDLTDREHIKLRTALEQYVLRLVIKKLQWVLDLENDDFAHAGCPPTYPIEVELMRLQAKLIKEQS